MKPRIGFAALVVSAFTALAVGGWAPAAHAVGIDAGDAVIVDPSNADKPLNGGASATYFGLRLPSDATCPGDSEHDNRRVQGFIVPIAADPTTLRFRGTKPEGEGQWALYQANTETYASILTLRNDVAGQPGRLDTLPIFTFSVYNLTYLSPGRYRLGIACSFEKNIEKFWDTQVDIVAAPDDQPGGFTWTVVDAPEGAKPAPKGLPGTGSGIPTLAIPIAVVGVIVLLLTFIPRRRGQDTPTSEDPAETAEESASPPTEESV